MVAERPRAGEVLDLVGRLAGLLVAGSFEGTLRAESRLRAVAAVYGYEAQVSVLAESAVVSIDGVTRVVAHEPQIPQLHRVSALKGWLAQVGSGELPVGQARARLEALARRPQPYPWWLRTLGVVLFSVGFGVSVQPTWQEAAGSAVLGVVVGAVVVAADSRRRPAAVAPLLGSVLVGAGVLVASRQGWVTGGTIDLMIPALFVFIPGDAITMAVLELAAGRLTAGSARLAQSAVGLAVLAFGPVVAAAVLGVSQRQIFDQGVPPTLGAFAGWFGWVLFTVGVMLVFAMRPRDLPWAVAVVLGTYGAQLLAVRALGTLPGTFVAAAVMAAACLWLGRRPGTPPAFVLYLAAFFVLTPGSHGLRGLDAWLGGHPVQGLGDIADMAALIGAIAFGMLTAASLVGPAAPAALPDRQQA